MDFILLSLLYLLLNKKGRKSAILGRRRKYKTRPVFRNRCIKGEMIMFNELYIKDEDMFRRSFRMTTKQFDYLLDALNLLISRKRTHWKDSISARQRLAMTLRLVKNFAFLCKINLLRLVTLNLN